MPSYCAGKRKTQEPLGAPLPAAPTLEQRHAARVAAAEEQKAGWKRTFDRHREAEDREREVYQSIIDKQGELLDGADIARSRGILDSDEMSDYDEPWDESDSVNLVEDLVAAAAIDTAGFAHCSRCAYALINLARAEDGRVAELLAPEMGCMVYAGSEYELRWSGAPFLRININGCPLWDPHAPYDPHARDWTDAWQGANFMTDFCSGSISRLGVVLSCSARCARATGASAMC